MISSRSTHYSQDFSHMTKNLAPTNTPAAALSGGAHQSLASLRGNKGVLRVEVKTTSCGSTEAPSCSRKEIPEMDQHLLYCNRILECFVDENSRFFVVSVFSLEIKSFGCPGLGDSCSPEVALAGPLPRHWINVWRQGSSVEPAIDGRLCHQTWLEDPSFTSMKFH